MARGVSFNREELALLHETLTYALKRTFSAGEKVRLVDLRGRIEERLLDTPSGQSGTREPRALGLTEPESDALFAAVDTYCEALQQPLSAEVSQEKARRVRQLVARYHRPSGFFGRLRSLFGRG